jgi:hypothetical protein
MTNSPQNTTETQKSPAPAKPQQQNQGKPTPAGGKPSEQQK